MPPSVMRSLGAIAPFLPSTWLGMMCGAAKTLAAATDLRKRRRESACGMTASSSKSSGDQKTGDSGKRGQTQEPRVAKQDREINTPELSWCLLRACRACPLRTNGHRCCDVKHSSAARAQRSAGFCRYLPARNVKRREPAPSSARLTAAYHWILAKWPTARCRQQGILDTVPDWTEYAFKLGDPLPFLRRR